MKLRLRQVGLIFIAGVLVLLIASVAWCHLSLVRAQRFARAQLWSESREALELYLLVHPWNDEARLLYAETFVEDADFPNIDHAAKREKIAEQRVYEALRQLQLIKDDSKLGAHARLQEGRVYLLLLQQPSRAERALRRAIELDPNSVVAHTLLWKLMDLTGRSDAAEEIVWRVIELTPPLERPLRMREWFLSQFYPATANPMMDYLMDFITPEQPHSVQTEAIRFVRFRDTEPDSPLGYACLARWFQLDGELAYALKVLRDDAEKIKGEEQDPFYLATAIELMIELGEYDTASQMFDLWPKDKQSGFEYWSCKARILHEVRGQFAEALLAYDAALGVWPGTIDWLMYNRKADCLTQMGNVAGAEAERKKAEEIEAIMQENTTRHIRALLNFLDDRDKMLEVAKFYSDIHRSREAEFWTNHANSLTATNPATSSEQSAPHTDNQAEPTSSAEK